MRRVLLVPMLVLAGLAAAALGIVASTSRRTTAEVERRVRDVRRANALAFRFAHLAGEEEREVLAYQLEPTRAGTARLDAGDREMEALASEIGGLDLSPRGRALWHRVLSARAMRVRDRRALLAAVDRGDLPAIERAHGRWSLSTATTSARVADLSVFNLRGLERAISDMDRIRSQSLELLVFVLAAGGVLVLALSLWLDRHLVRPVRAMTDAARRIATRREAIAVPGGERDDELGVLSRAITRTAGDLVDANAELERSVAARDEFLSISSHELKTPLTALKLQLQGGLRRWPEQHGRAPVPPWLGAALRQVDRVEVLVAELLDVARIRSGRLTLRHAPVDLAEMARGVAERMREVLARTGNALDLEIGGRLEAECDGGRIEQVLGNLLANAAQHAPGTHVVLRVARDGERAVLSVEDEGPGVPEDARERVFDAYERAGEGRRGPGLGLGLYIARQIVDSHGGRIEAVGNPRGGARFVVELPLHRGCAAAAPPPAARAS